MPAAGQDADGASTDERVERALTHLVNALNIVDTIPGSSNVGAKIQEAIEALEELGCPD